VSNDYTVSRVALLMNLKPDKVSSKEYKELVLFLRSAGHAYYVLDDPVIDDAEYDQLYRLLESIEKNNPDFIILDSPTQKIGGEILKEFPQVSINPPMLSLANAADKTEFTEFQLRVQKEVGEQVSFHVEPKFDGLAIELMYLDGQLVQGCTRGNGTTGEGILHNLKTISSIPLYLIKPYPKLLTIRGEVVLSFKEFDRINNKLRENGKKTFANPRNAAAGTLRQQNSLVTAGRRLAFLPYGFGKWEGESKPEKQSEFWSILPGLGFFPEQAEFAPGLQDVIKAYEKYQFNRNEFPYDIDGLVVKLDDYQHWFKLGSTSKSPRYAIAFKFPSRSAFTTLESIDYQLGRTGIVTPVANLSPVNIGGVMVRRATLHNKLEMQRIGCNPGDKVEVKRAGDVIPKIIKVIERGKEQSSSEFPKDCPSCNETLLEEDVFVRCANPECDNVVLARLQFSASKEGLDIEGLGGEWVEKFFLKKNVRDLGDLFSLEKSDLEGMEGMGETLSNKILSAIENKKDLSLHVFLKGLGIPQVGSYAAELIATHYPSIEQILKAGEDDLLKIHEVGPGIAKSILEYIHSSRFTELYEKCIKAGLKLTEEKLGQAGKLSGASIVFTGTLPNLTRDQAGRLAKTHGARIATSLSKSTDYLVAGEKAGSKLKKAEELKVTILSEADFLEIVGPS
jgi:DNA ligase (NAD+)